MKIRHAERTDLDACYAISLATGLAGGDASHLYRDPHMMGHIYVAPYVMLAAELAFVVEDDEGIAGFAVGTDDTPAWEDRLERQWWPELRARYADPRDVPPEQRTPDQRRAWMIHHPERTPATIAMAYPAHLHMNLLPRQQRRGVGAQLLDRWLDAANRRAVHVGVNRANSGAAAFWRKCRFEPLALDSPPNERTLWMGRDDGR
ncbi:MAG: GNAT family N-acetyltransferase [Reyranella sp.]|nr:GNAT family N-acetyltransferase [Reyranella sp.]